MDYAALKAELDAGHPVTGTYNADAALAAAELNALNVNVIKERMTGQEMFESTDGPEFAGLTDAKKSQWISFCSIAEHDPRNNGPVHKFVEYIFGNTSDTRSNLISSRMLTTSRGALIGFGKTVKASHVTHARTL